MIFKSFPDRLDTANDLRKKSIKPMTFGNRFLDDACGGIFPEDLAIITARTGGGKTELVTQIAMANARAGNQVKYFALEAHQGEIELRIKFKFLAQSFFTQMNYKSYGKFPNYQDWVHNKQNDILEKFEPETDIELRESLKTLHTFYRSSSFDLLSFESHMHRIGETSDLIIIDHLHFFDFDSDNENKDLKQAVKHIKHLTDYYRVPAILVVQLRKQDKKTKSILPDLEDIHGSSDIAKVATKIIATAPAKNEPKADAHIFPTYFKVLKNRTDGSRCFYTALCGFDVQRNIYAENYQLGEMSYDESEFSRIELYNYPQWAKAETRY